MMQPKDSDIEQPHNGVQNKNNPLSDQEAFFQDIFENNSAAIAILEVDTTVSMVNNAFCKMSGYSKEELIGTSWIEKIPPEEAKRMKEFSEQRFLNSPDAPDKYEFTFYTKGGEIRFGLVSVSIMKSAKKAIASFTDITKQKQTEEAYRLSEDRFRSLIEHASDVVYTLTSEGIFTYASPNWTEQFGHELSEVIGHSFAEFVHPNDIERLRILITQNFLDGEKLTNVEYQIGHKNGQWKWFSSSSSPILDSKGKVTTLIGIAHDITQRKLTEEALQKSEALLNTLIKTIPDLIWLKDIDGVYLSCNTMFERFFGAPIKEITGKTDYDFVDRELADFFRKNDQIAMEKGAPSNNEEWVTFADDGHRALLDTIKTPMYTQNGELIGVLGVARDITERKKILSQFESTNALLSSVLESSPKVVMFAIDKNYHYLTFNKKHQEIIWMIWGKEIAIGTNMMDVFGNHPDKEKAKANFDRTLAGEYLSVVEEYGDEEKTRQFWQDYYSPIYSSNGEIIGITCFVLDISELKRAEAALKESEYFFKESQNAAFIGSYKVNFARGTWESSEVMDQIFGIDKNYDRTINEGWTGLIHPEDRAFMQKQMIEDVITKHQPFNAEYRIVRKSDSETRWVNGLGKMVVNDQGDVISLIGTIMDITERKIAEQTILKSQQNLDMALRISHLGTWEYDVKTDLFTFTDGLYSLYHTTAAQVGGYNLSSSDYIERFVHPDDKKLVVQEVKHLFNLKNQKLSRQLEHRIVYADGGEGYITVHIANIKDEQGNIVKHYGINQDITERKKAEEELRTSETQLRELNATKDKFFSIIAHDLRNPFAVVLGISEMMADRSFHFNIKEMRQNSDLLYKTASSTFALLENLLEWSTLQRGISKLKVETISLPEFIENLNESTRDMASKKSVQLITKIPEKATIKADPNMLRSILRNLITNAIKFTNQGGTVAIETQKQADDSCLFIVKDSGIGMPESIIRNLFRIDANVNRPGTNGEPSTGLGLILCKEFVEKHEGKIWVESEENKGSSFYFTIPAHKA